jgi:hypothetical protein
MSLTCQDSRANADTPYFLPVEKEGLFRNNTLPDSPCNIPLYITNGFFGIGNIEPAPEWYLKFALRLEPSNAPSFPNMRQAQISLSNTTDFTTSPLRMLMTTFEDKSSPSWASFIIDGLTPLFLTSNSVLAQVPLIATNNINGSGTQAELVIQDNLFSNGVLDFYNPSNTYRFCNSNDGNLYVDYCNASNNFTNMMTFNGQSNKVLIPNIEISNIQVTNALYVGTTAGNQTIISNATVNTVALNLFDPSNIFRIANEYSNGILEIRYSNVSNNFTTMMSFNGTTSPPIVTVPNMSVTNLSATDLTIVSNVNLPPVVTIGNDIADQTIISNGTVTTKTLVCDNIVGGYKVTPTPISFNWIQIGNMLQQWGIIFYETGGIPTDIEIVLPVNYVDTNYTIQITVGLSTTRIIYTAAWYSPTIASFRIALPGNNAQYLKWFTCGAVSIPPSVPPAPTFTDVTYNSATATCVDPSQTGSPTPSYTITYETGGTTNTVSMSGTSTPGTYTANLTGLSASSVYSSIVTATNVGGFENSASANFTTIGIPNPPSNPPIYTLGVQNETGFALNLSDPSQSGGLPLTYMGYWNDGVSTSGSQALTSNAPGSYTFSNTTAFTPNTRYNLYSTVSNDFGLGTSPVFVGSTNSNISKPNPISGTSNSPEGTVVFWDITGVTPVDDFGTNVYYGTTAFPTTVNSNIVFRDGNLCSTLLTGLSPATVYFVEVIAFTSSSNIVWSDYTTFSTP